MRTSLRVDRRVRRLCRNAVLLAVAFALSFLEHMLPLSFLLPLPGVKLGLANVVTVLAFFYLSPLDAAVISLLRICLSALLFGTPVSFLFSLLGGSVAYLTLFVGRMLLARMISFIGVCILSATGHHIGQMTAAVWLFDSGVLRTYLPVLLLAGVVMGCLTGLLLNLCNARVKRLFEMG